MPVVAKLGSDNAKYGLLPRRDQKCKPSSSSFPKYIGCCSRPEPVRRWWRRFENIGLVIDNIGLYTLRIDSKKSELRATSLARIPYK